MNEEDCAGDDHGWSKDEEAEDVQGDESPQQSLCPCDWHREFTAEMAAMTVMERAQSTAFTSTHERSWGRWQKSPGGQSMALPLSMLMAVSRYSPTL